MGNKLDNPGRFVERQRPFSPLDAGVLEEEAREAFFDTRQMLFSDYQDKPQIIVGRRGAGKTAFLESAFFTNRRDLVVSVDKAAALGQVCLMVNGVPSGARYPEAVAKLWDSVIWTAVFQEAVRQDSALKLCRDYLARLGASPSTSPDSVAWALVESVRQKQTGNVATIAELIHRLHNVTFNDAKRELSEALGRRHGSAGRSRAIVLLDSLESEGYVFEDPDTLAALKGLLKWIGDVGSSQDPIEARVSIPGEYYHDFLAISSNPLKDFARSSVLRWTPRSLITLAATRYRKFLELTGHRDFEVGSDVDLTLPHNALGLFRRFLPETIPVGAGKTEDCLLFVLRHTQLLPRQFFIMLNRLWYTMNENEPISVADVLAAVRETAQITVMEICGAYNHRYPDVFKSCTRLFPLAVDVLPYGDLHKCFKHVRNARGDVEAFFDMLVEIGAVGRVIESTDKYVRGQFQYNYDSPLSVKSNDTLCLHPLFRVGFGEAVVGRPGVSSVWPVGV